jgi:hypothetical protein
VYSIITKTLGKTEIKVSLVGLGAKKGEKEESVQDCAVTA